MSDSMSHAQPNRLINETSPYLLQHAYNPVDWYPWGEEAFAAAREQGKAIFLSIGYSACHWCHVMEHESFENEAIASLLNDNFISIKVDREERPDVDQIYMSAVQLITQRGGWPMSVFMTPEGKPFYGGTYWPPTSRMGMPGFGDIVVKLADYWTTKRTEVDSSADQLVDAIQQMAAPVFAQVDLNEAVLLRAVTAILSSADLKHGGFGGAPKFPHPMDIRLLLRGWKRFKNEKALHVATLTLEKMSRGGIYDHLGGGFHRYATDAYWLAPHFEKMLYDNALLVPAYLEAFQVTGTQIFANSAVDVLDYVLKEMTSPQGGFYSTQDADSEGEEGKFFVWSKAEIEEVLGVEDALLFCEVFDVSASGNWEGKNILNRTHSSPQETDPRLSAMKQQLFEVRGQRISPGRDEKILVAWNGMMISAMSQAALVLQREDYLHAAEMAASFVLENLRDENGRLLHSYKDHRARFQAYLDDYACLIDALGNLYQASGEESWLVEATKLAEEMIRFFADEAHGGFYFTAIDHEQLITRTKDSQDNAVPSGNGMAATALLKLGRLLHRNDFEEAGVKTLDSIGGMLVDHPRATAQSMLALDFLLGPTYEVVFAMNSPMLSSDWNRVLQKQFLPNLLALQLHESTQILHDAFAGKSVAETERAYICERGLCQSPVETLCSFEDLILQL